MIQGCNKGGWPILGWLDCGLRFPEAPLCFPGTYHRNVLSCCPAALPPSVIDSRVFSTLLGAGTPSRLRSCFPTDGNQIRTEPT